VLNDAYVERKEGPDNPWHEVERPHRESSFAVDSDIDTSDIVYYRVYEDSARPDAMQGEWLTTRRVIRGTDSYREARRVLALPDSESYDSIARLRPPAETPVRRSIAGASFGEPGGAVQIQLLDNVNRGWEDAGRIADAGSEP